MAQGAPPVAAPAQAPAPDDDFHTTDEDIVVTAPYVRSLDILGNVSVLEGDELEVEYLIEEEWEFDAPHYYDFSATDGDDKLADRWFGSFSGNSSFYT